MHRHVTIWVMGAVLLGRLFLYTDNSGMKIWMKKMKRENTSHWQPMNYRAKVANASYRTVPIALWQTKIVYNKFTSAIDAVMELYNLGLFYKI